MSSPASSHAVAAVAHLPAGDYALDVKECSVTLDNSWVPYGQLSLTCVRPPESVLEELDPREDNVRVTVTLTRKSDPYVGDAGAGPAHLWGYQNSREFDVLLVARDAATKDRTIVLRCDTDEALLLGDALVDTEPDSFPFTMQESLREIIDYVLDRHGSAALYTPGGPPFDPLNDEGEADASLDYFADETNLITNPSAETNLTGWAANHCTLTRITGTATGVVGGASFRLQSPVTDNNAYAYYDVPVVAGQTYAFSGVWILAGSTVGSANSLARKIAITDGVTVLAQSNAATVSGERVGGEVTIPTGTSSVRVRIYHGYTTSGDIRWDALKFTVKTAVLDPHEYFDGDTADNDIYTFSWTGPAHASTSTRVTAPGVSLDVDALTWQPGVTAWEFLEPLVQAVGLRFYCDEARVWHLVDPALVPAGTLAVAENVNLVAADESISRYAEWFDAVVVRYAWSTDAGVAKVKYDVATEVVGTPKAVLRIDENRPYPGPGYAAAVLHRAEGRGRVFGITALSDYRVTPGDSLEALVPDTPEQNGRVSAVTWDLPSRQMTIRSSGLIDVSPTAWIELDAGVAWTASPVGESWLEETA